MKSLFTILGISYAAGSLAYADAKPVTENEAKKIALTKVPGEVREVETETHDGKEVFSVEITDKSGAKVEVLVDVKSGNIVKVEQGDKEDDVK
ncbi:MAG: peptidase [Proteobacteria bacterium]|nr:MAG: peptidase [Pseudomonadota bacterium]